MAARREELGLAGRACTHDAGIGASDGPQVSLYVAEPHRLDDLCGALTDHSRIMLAREVGRAKTCSHVQASTVRAKRTFPADGGPSPGALHLATAFPRPVWLDHLLPLLTLRGAVTLRVTCRAVRDTVAEMRADLGERPVKHLKAMLTCFPKAHTIDLHEKDYMDKAERDSLLAWLKERGNCLTCIQRTHLMGTFIPRAWQAGLFKTVKSVILRPYLQVERGLITDGFVSGVESITFVLLSETPAQFGVLERLRTFPALKDLECHIYSSGTRLPPLIPPSLEGLSLRTVCIPSLHLLLGSLPPMIASSGAKLRRLTLSLKLLDGDTACGVRGLLQTCASTLKQVTLTTGDPFESAVEVAEGLASCQHLERVEVPISAFAVMPPGGSVTSASHIWSYPAAVAMAGPCRASRCGP
jgi:hypothetical protein